MLQSSSSAHGDLLLSEPSLPAWLNPSAFVSDDFKPEEQVAELRRFVPLPTLQSELESYLATLKTKVRTCSNAQKTCAHTCDAW